MASKGGIRLMRQAIRGARPQESRIQPNTARCMATEAQQPNATLSTAFADAHITSTTAEPISEDFSGESQSTLSSWPRQINPLKHIPPPNPFITSTQCTLHSFPKLEPTGFASYPSTHLLLPLRRDILHRAVTFEADSTRQGSANTKWRDEVHGSTHKIRPQKGSGRARLGDKKSPMLRGGGVAHGPKPRDFSTDLPKKMYDIAWRTALSYRYRRGQLVVIDGEVDIEDIHENSRTRYLCDLLRSNRMGNPDGRTLFVTEDSRAALLGTFEDERARKEAKVIAMEDVKVKNLLELGRIVIEHKALNRILNHHQTDLTPLQRFKLGPDCLPSPV